MEIDKGGKRLDKITHNLEQQYRKTRLRLAFTLVLLLPALAACGVDITRTTNGPTGQPSPFRLGFPKCQIFIVTNYDYGGGTPGKTGIAHHSETLSCRFGTIVVHIGLASQDQPFFTNPDETRNPFAPNLPPYRSVKKDG